MRLSTLREIVDRFISQDAACGDVEVEGVGERFLMLRCPNPDCGVSTAWAADTATQMKCPKCGKKPSDMVP